MSERTDDYVGGVLNTPETTAFSVEDPNEDHSEKSERSRGLLANMGELALLVVIAFSLAWLIKTFVGQPFFIPSASMEPTLVPGDHVFVNKIAYQVDDPKRGDIIVFRYPMDPSKDYIKRVVGLPGDSIKVSGGVLYRNGDRVKEPYIAMPRDSSDYPTEGKPVVVPKDKYFVMGDNRANSADSRVWGFLREDFIIGKAFVIYFPIGRVGLID